VLFEQIAERLIRQFLKVHHAVVSQEINRLPRSIIELNALSRHQPAASTRPLIAAVALAFLHHSF
jgi:hypothetical protein